MTTPNEPAHEPEKELKDQQATDEPHVGHRAHSGFAQMQADLFGSLGATIARYPLPFIAVLFLAYLGFGFGLWNMTLVTDPWELWMHDSSRVVDERAMYERYFYGSDRGAAIQMVHKKEGTNLLKKEYMDVATVLDSLVLDMRPSNDTTLMATYGCLGVTDEGICDENNFCRFIDGQCLFQDKFGLMPSSKQKGGALFRYKGVDWGWREVCNEVETPPVNPTVQYAVNTSKLRAPCSKQFTPLDCFVEGPASQQWGTLDLLGWNRTHKVSINDEEKYPETFENPCFMWNGGYNAKEYTIGDADFSQGRVGGLKFLYPVYRKEAFMNKYNNFLMKHPTSRVFLRQNGFPETITEDDAEAIIHGFEKAFGDAILAAEQDGRIPSELEVRMTTNWHFDQIAENASERNQHYVVIGLVLLLVVVWMFLLATDFVYSRLTLGFFGVISVALAVFATLGFSALCSISFNGLTLQVLPYVSMGLGIDDMFVLTHYLSEDPRRNVITRMRECYAHAGPSVCTTSLINACIFFLGYSVPIPAVQDFSLQAGISVIANFLIILFAFGGMLSYDAQRIQARRYDVCFVQKAELLQPRRLKIDISHAIVQKVWRPVITMLPLNIAVLVVTAVLLGLAIWGCTEVERGLPIHDFLDDGSRRKDYFEMRDKYFAAQANAIVGGQAEWHTRENQEKLTYLLNNQVLAPKNKFNLSGGELEYSSPSFQPMGVAWLQLFRRFALQYPGGQDPQNDCSCWPDRYQYPTDGLVHAARLAMNTHDGMDAGPYHFRGLAEIPANCTINPDRYYDLLKLFLGHTSCLENGTVPANETIADVKDSVYYTRKECRQSNDINPVTDDREYIAPTCAQVESSVSQTNFVYPSRDIGVMPPTGPGGYGQVSPYRNDVRLTSDMKRIEAWVVPMLNDPVSPSNVPDVLNMMAETRKLFDNSGLPVFATGISYYNGEQYRFIREDARTLLICCVCLALFITAVMLLSPTIALIQTAVIGCSVTVIVAFLPATGLLLNAISLASIMFGVGVNVETCVHISRAFLVTTTKEVERESGRDTSEMTPLQLRQERVLVALGQMVMPVFDGAFTTFMGVVVLAFSETRFFRAYFFGFYALMVLVSLFFAFFLLPVLLALVGPQGIDIEVAHNPADGEEFVSGVVDEQAAADEEMDAVKAAEQ